MKRERDTRELRRLVSVSHLSKASSGLNLRSNQSYILVCIRVCACLSAKHECVYVVRVLYVYVCVIVCVSTVTYVRTSNGANVANELELRSLRTWLSCELRIRVNVFYLNLNGKYLSEFFVLLMYLNLNRIKNSSKLLNRVSFQFSAFIFQ